MATKQDEWQAKNTMWVSIRIQNSSGIPKALESALINTGKTKNAYIIDAIREKLQRDGYLTQKQE